GLVIAYVAIAAIFRNVFAKIAEQCLSSATQCFGKLLHSFKFCQLIFFIFCILGEFPKHNYIGKTVEKYGMRWHSIAATSAYFLIISINIFWHIILDYPADIAFVNAHSKRH